jgi:tetratricopeptide (TPR) repeat protein
MIYLNLLNRIFGPKKSLTRAEIEELKSDDSSFEAQLKAEDDGFNTEAMEGWSSTDVDFDTSMQSLDKKMNEHFALSSNNQSGKSVALFIGIFTAAMLTLILYTYQGNQLNNEDVQLDNQQIIQNLTEENISKEIPLSNQRFLDDKIENIASFTPIKKSDQITKDQLKNQDNQKTTAASSTQERDILDRREPVSGQLSPKPLHELPQSRIKTLPYREVSEVYLNDLKAVDYRQLREEKPIRLLQELPTGTPANQSNDRTFQTETDDIQARQINYIDYLEETQRYFDQQAFKRALRRYLIILEHYPEDVNAHFYSGLCYHNLGQYAKAIEHFDQSFTLQIGNFREESEWFKAKALLQLKDQYSAKVLLDKIQQERGFYSERATELLNSL